MKLKMKMTTGIVAAGLLLAGLASAPQVFAGSPTTPAPAVEKAEKPGDVDDAALLATAKITAAQATSAAIAAYPGATVSSATIEDEDGVPTYSVQLTSGGKQYDVKVNAITGAVGKAEDGGADSASDNG